MVQLRPEFLLLLTFGSSAESSAMPIDKCLDDLVDIEPGRFGIECRDDAMPQHRRRDRANVFRCYVTTLV